MKAIERNISRHENGTFYFVARRGGRLTVRSLKTDNLEEARRKIRELGINGLTAAREPAVPMLAGVAESAPAAVAAPVVSLAAAIAEHDRGLVLLSAGAREMAARGKRVILQFASGWDFSPIEIWQKYRETGVERQGKELTSAANHLLWYMRKFIPWAVGRGFLKAEALEELKKLKKLQTNSRRIRVPSEETVDEFLKMVSSEDQDGGEFLRFLACTGLRLRGATGLTWRDVDLAASQIVVRQKGGKEKVLPIGPEAVEILERRRKLPRPFGLDQKALEKLERKMKRFAKGFEIDLTMFHAFRHYFASRCLMAGLTVQEVATLLGHSDGGVLVLKTYGHICGAHLRNAVAGLRLARAA